MGQIPLKLGVHVVLLFLPFPTSETLIYFFDKKLKLMSYFWPRRNWFQGIPPYAKPCFQFMSNSAQLDNVSSWPVDSRANLDILDTWVWMEDPIWANPVSVRGSRIT